MKRKKDKFFLTFQSGDLNPRFSHSWFEFSCEVRSPRSNRNKLLKEIGLYKMHSSSSCLHSLFKTKWWLEGPQSWPSWHQQSTLGPRDHSLTTLNKSYPLDSWLWCRNYFIAMIKICILLTIPAQPKAVLRLHGSLTTRYSK